MTRATTSIRAKVNRYWVSATVREKRGATKNRSKATTLSSESSIPGPRPKRIVTSTTPSRYNMTTFARSNTLSNPAATRVVAAQVAAAQT